MNAQSQFAETQILKLALLLGKFEKHELQFVPRSTEPKMQQDQSQNNDIEAHVSSFRKEGMFFFFEMQISFSTFPTASLFLGYILI
jgi:hypothetical protein